MEYIKAIEKIHSLGNFSLPPTLERIKKVLEKLSNPQDSFKAIHIAGTNGKGSVATMTAEILRLSGYKTGLFTSPFIIDFRERIRINGEFIEKESLVRLTEKVLALNISLTEFELITAVAFLYFKEQNCDVAVIETGLGGRFDATNALNSKLVSVITKIGLDHTAILGESIEKIASEKCGIIKDEPTVCIIGQDAEAQKVIEKSANRLILPDENALKIIKSDFDGNEFCYKGEVYKTSLSGEFQIKNAVTVIEVIENCGLNISRKAIKNGLLNAQNPARLESFLNGRIILDGAHNLDAARELLKTVNKSKDNIAIVGMMKDKAVDEVLSTLLPHFKKVITVGVADLERSLTACEIAFLSKKYCRCVDTAKSYNEALLKALKEDERDKIFIFGSLYLAADIRPLLLELK